METTISNILDFFKTVIEFTPRFIPGVLVTFQLSILSIILGTIIGIIVVLLKLTHNKFFIQLTNMYISIIRGTPLLLQLLFIYRVATKLDVFVVAVIGLALHNGAYISEIFRGSIESIHYGQNEAAKALGMTKFQAFKRIILPQAVKRSIPSLGNQFIIAVKDSSLASTITITETLLLSRQFTAATWNPSPILFTAGCYYYIIIFILTKILYKIEQRLKINER